ncbi:unnamed protein product [Polarella glacialis]|uniref:Cytochrome b5 heme-binding domain-containing protein n=2 Tax=Polarella glacialis TaxID=89957 RepID=A0A813ICZ3_POLGL|nr:unnamed protein product [Polarella glacialis]
MMLTKSLRWACVAALCAASDVSSDGLVPLSHGASWPGCAEEGICVFTEEFLRSFTGRRGSVASSEDKAAGLPDSTILVSVASYVFNVTSAPQYYRPDFGNYGKLAGREASRALGMMSMEDEDVDSHLLADLTEDQWEELFNWIDKFQGKYPLVGRLTGWKPLVTMEDINERSGFSLKPPPISEQLTASADAEPFGFSASDL